MPAFPLPRFRLVGELPATVAMGAYSYLVHLDDAGVRSASYLMASGIDSWMLASILPGDKVRALEILRRGFTPPFDGRSSEICEALVGEGVFEAIPGATRSGS